VLRAGFAKADITPEVPLPLMGYDFRQHKLPPSDEILDPIFARVLVLQDGTAAPRVLVSLDLAVLRNEQARELRQRVADRAETDHTHVIVACTHTHSAPAVAGNQDSDIAEYFDHVMEQTAAAAARAQGLTYPVEARVHTAPIALAYDRRVRTKDGLRMCWNPQEFPDLAPLPAADPNCSVLSLRQINGPREFLIFNVGAHGTVLGKTSNVISADWPGAACRLLEQHHPHRHALFLQGACGHAHPWVATQEAPEGIDTVGRAAAGFVDLLAQALRPTDGELQHANADFQAPKASLDISVWRIGGVWLVALPVELFGELALGIRHRLDGPVLIATCAQGWNGYWPDAGAFADGKYEVDSAQRNGLSPGDGERLVDAVLDLAASLSNPPSRRE
jgi:ABC-type nickel/cobalt efflux system permease component RcnA